MFNKIAVLLLAVPLGGCLATNGGLLDFSWLTDSTAESIGTYQAPTLSAMPGESGCAHRDQRCRALDQHEANLYQAARTRRISWTQLVDGFYTERLRLFPTTNDSYGAREIYSYQRMLAEQMDQRRMSESQWAYYVQQKYAEMSARSQQNEANAAIVRQQQQQQRQAMQPAPLPQQRNCWTTRSGNSYQTTCN